EERAATIRLLNEKHDRTAAIDSDAIEQGLGIAAADFDVPRHRRDVFEARWRSVQDGTLGDDRGPDSATPLVEPAAIASGVSLDPLNSGVRSFSGGRSATPERSPFDGAQGER